MTMAVQMFPLLSFHQHSCWSKLCMKSTQETLQAVLRTACAYALHPKRHHHSQSTATVSDSEDKGFTMRTGTGMCLKNQLHLGVNSTSLQSLTAREDQALRGLKAEHSVWSSLGYETPKAMSNNRWLQVLKEHPNEESRKAIYQYWHREDNILKRKPKDVFAKEVMDTQNTFLAVPTSDQAEMHYKNNLAKAMVFGMPLVFDFSFDHEMSTAELNRLVMDFKTCHEWNKCNRDPFHFYLCGIAQGSRVHRSLQKSVPEFDTVPFTVTEESYLELFPREKLVYLCPDSPRVLKKYSRNEIYIIGCLDEMLGEKPLTYGKAIKEEIRSAQLPLDRYICWSSSFHSLGIHMVVDTMLELKRSPRDWLTALQRVHPRIPRRFEEDNC